MLRAGRSGHIGLWAAALVAALGASAGQPARSEQKPADVRQVILDTNSYWRVRPEWGQVFVRPNKESKAQPFTAVFAQPQADAYTLLPAPKAVTVTPAEPPENWSKPEFDDAAWAMVRGPINLGGTRGPYNVTRLYLRARFVVDDPAKAAGLSLDVAYRGGVVAYVNGTEVGRGHIRDGGVSAATLADDYPSDAYVDPDGFVLRIGWGDPDRYKERFALRQRSLNGVAIPATALRKGVNVLTVEIHSPAYDAALFTGKPRQYEKYYCWWLPMAFSGLRLTAPAGSAAAPNAGRPKGLNVWTCPATWRVTATDFGDRAESAVRPIRITACRNAAFSAQAVVSSSDPIAGLKAACSDLSGAGTIPADAVELRYSRPDMAFSWQGGLWFDGLETAPPEPVALLAEGKGAVQPVWVTVNVPRDAPPGDYRGTLSLRAGGAQPVEVPIELKLSAWTLPDTQKFGSFIDLLQSPETLALKYNVAMWSDDHWRLIDESFKLLGQVGNKTVWIPLIARTHLGNEHSMLRWIKNPSASSGQGGGGYDYDFSVVDRYLDVATKLLGKVPVVCLLAWEKYSGGGYFGKGDGAGKPVQVSVLDPKTGALSLMDAPMFGTPECPAFWKPVFDALRERLAKRGLEKAMMTGPSQDVRPLKFVIDDFKKFAPDLKWLSFSHPACTELYGYPVGYMTDVWTTPGIPDVAKERRYGWQLLAKGSRIEAGFPREGCNTVGKIWEMSPFGQYRASIEGFLAAGRAGFGRCGADYWPVLKTAQGMRITMNRFPESDWSNLSCPHAVTAFLAPGKTGPRSTARLEAVREGMQEAETRIVIERALLDPARKAALGDELAARCQQVLDARTRAILAGIHSDIGWQGYLAGAPARTGQLFAVAAEVAAKLAPK